MLQFSVPMTSWVQVWLALGLFATQFSDKVLLDTYMKVNGMRIKEILRRIWLLSANKIKPSESICKQSSQVKLELNLSFWQIITAIYCRHSFGFQNSKIDSFLYSKAFCSPYICLARKQIWISKKNCASNIIIFVCALSKANTAMTNEVFDYVWADKIETSLAKT